MRPSSSPFVTDRTGRAPVTALAVIESTAAPTSENRLNDWYNRRRVPEIVRAGPFHTAYRYAAATRVDGRRRFLQLFETDAAAPDDAIARFFAEWRPAEAVPDFVDERAPVVFAHA